MSGNSSSALEEYPIASRRSFASLGMVENETAWSSRWREANRDHQTLN